MVTYSYCIVALLLILPLNCNGANTTSIFDIRDEKYMTAKYTVVLLFPVFLLYGIISNILMAIVCFSRGNLYGRAFILITLQIIICNLISFIPHMIVLLPEILLTKNSLYSSKIWINRVFSTINTSSFYAVLHFAFLWTLNRFLSIIFPKFNVLFESTKLYFLIIFFLVCQRWFIHLIWKPSTAQSCHAKF
ncbi:unnamed protein product [Brugia pahangi]|uniref:G_PROTEIN_RECEP_F1_2 domain-containing protein n=1 Tax=Brugia pahangi TaxID=6280 RepID=A0A0N4T6E1_BRUPA|nr:unnamed protein product [Brugia pahangi]